MAMPLAERLIVESPENSEAALCYAWACLENGEPVKARYYCDLSSQLKGDPVVTRMYKGYLQMRLSNFEGAVYEFNMTEGRQKELLAWTYLNKSKSLASIGQPEKAETFYELALMMDNNAHPEWKNLRKYFDVLPQLKKDIRKLKPETLEKLFKLAAKAQKENEHIFALSILKKINSLEVITNKFPKLVLMEMESMLKLHQYTALEEKIDKYGEKFEEDEKFSKIKEALDNFRKKKKEGIDLPESGNSSGKAVKQVVLAPSSGSRILSLKLFDGIKFKDSKIKDNLTEVNLASVPLLGLEVAYKNPYYNKKKYTFNCFVGWYHGETLLDQSSFQLEIPEDWDAVLLNEFCDTKKTKLWKNGPARVEFFVDKKKALEYNFLIGKQNVIKNDILKSEEAEPEEEEPLSLQDALESLEKIVGLKNVKNSIHELIDYLEYMKERKELGLKAKDKISVNATFLGNPGTGKTTVARMLGKIFKAMGLLKKGDVIEVDRGALVGQYVGETAQKTEKVLENAVDNLLFIDEAYTLVKKGANNDFGQEAIDVILKKMEDRRGDFFVIAAGYPKEMEDFLESNPGLKSRFTHHFTFEDYEPEDLMEIFRGMIKSEEYRMMNSAEVFLMKQFTMMYRNRDKNFGNARTVRKTFEDVKMQLSRRYLSLPKEDRSKEKMITITEEDVKAVFTSATDIKSFQAPVNEELLNEALTELNNLTGLSSVKQEVNELVKLARYYYSQGENLAKKFSSHLLFFGNPGTGKTTVARIVGKIYSALGILPRGHLVETDRQNLVAGFIGQTAAKTTEVIQSAIGGTLFIDEAYTLVNKDSSGDFGREAIDTLLKAMEDKRGEFIVIAAGYTDEMKGFLESNPGMKSRFTKTFFFEDYQPDELLTIFEALSAKNRLKVNESAREMILKHFNKLYRERDKNFGNARLVRNLFDKINKKHTLRMMNLDPAEISEETRSIISIEDLSDISSGGKAVKKEITGDEEKLKEYIEELKNLTGLDEVKSGIEKLVNSLKIARVRKERGLNVVRKPLHSVFTGNPGTGKTTVARLISNIFKELGVIEKGHLVEVDRAQLVAGYSGQTAIKTDEIIQSAIGGTLFIDEAYTLARGSGDFGQEAIDTLLKRMEDYKDDLIVIVAGYTNEMKSFMQSNPGLTSRFVNSFHFADYIPDQLIQITRSMAKSNGYEFNREGLAALYKKFVTLYNNRDSNFGNARAARNMLLEIISNQENRIINLMNPSDDDLTTLTEKDIT